MGEQGSITTVQGWSADPTSRPQCPQVHVDVGHLLRIPEDEAVVRVPEDEFECLNLNITVPSGTKADAKLPTLIWIHGGSQTVTFPSAASKCGDQTRIVAQSIQEGRPIIFVSFNYRLNVFAFGDQTGEKNLALKDQKLAIAWVKNHIAGFGGDPERLTVAGESSGAVHAHAQLVADPTLSGVLASGSLYLSPPLPLSFGNSLLSRLSTTISELHQGKTVATAPAAAIVQALSTHNVVSMFLQEDPSDHTLTNWQQLTPRIKRLMLGDVEHEASIWRNGQDPMSAASLVSAFDDTDPVNGPALRRLYGIAPNRAHASRDGVVDFITDARFALPVEDMWTAARKEQGSSARWYRYLFDEPNPWHASSRAHHGVDLVMLFGGLDISHNPHAESVGHAWRSKWITFVAGEEPWVKERRYAFGPFGQCRELDVEEGSGERGFSARRRTRAMAKLREMGWSAYNPIFFKVAAGKVSLVDA